MLTNHSRPNTPPSPGDDEADGAVLPPTDTVPLWVTGPDYTATCVELAVVHVDGHTDQISLDGAVLGCITCSGDDMFTARPGTCPTGDGTCVQAPSWDRAAARILRARGVAR